MSIEEIFQTMRELAAEQFAMEPAEITMETSFEEDLGADSVEVIDLLMSLEDEFQVEIPDEAIDEIRTVGELTAYIEEHS